MGKKVVKTDYRKLAKLADFLETDAKNPKGIKFDMAIWANVDPEAEKIEATCSTAACAFGAAAVAKLFDGLTFHIVADQIWKNDLHDFGGKGGGGYVPMKVLTPRYKGKTDLEAARLLFGLTQGEACYLFTPGSYVHEQRGRKGELFVAKRIRNFIVTKQHFDEVKRDSKLMKSRLQALIKSDKDFFKDEDIRAENDILDDILGS